MARWRNPFVVAVVAFVAVVALIVVAALSFDPDRFRPEISALLSEAAGRPVELAGPIRLRWKPAPSVEAEDVRFDAPGLRVEAARVRVEVAASALFGGNVEAQRIVVEGLGIELVAASADAADGVVDLPSSASLPVRRIEIDGGAVRRDGRTLVEIVTLLLRDPADAAGARFEFDGRTGDQAVQARGRVRAGGQRVQLGQLVVTIPPGVVHGDLEIAFDAARPRVRGALRADALTVPVAAGGARLIPRVEIDPAVLASVDAALRLHVGRLSIGRVRIEEIGGPLELDGGMLELRPGAIVAGGPTTARLRVDAAASTWKLDVEIADADAGRLLVMFGAGNVEPGGRLTLSSALTARGRDSAALVSSLSGRLAVDAGGMHLRAGAAEVAGADVFAMLARALRGSSDDRIAIECAVARFDVVDGVLSNEDGIGVQSRAMNLLGGGRVSLVDEQVALAFRPWPREGLGLSASAVVGTVAVNGPLADPQVGLTGESVLRGGVTAGAALMTGGLSLIAQGLLERARGDRPCEQAAGAAPAPAASRSAAPRAPSGGVGGSIREGAESAGRFIEGLFGGSGGGADAPSGRADR